MYSWEATVVGQFSDSNRVSQSLQTPSRESRKLKPVQRRSERERESVSKQPSEEKKSSASVSWGRNWSCTQEPLERAGAEEGRRRIDSPLASQL